ncbi:MAG: acetylornithine/succinylornithine family transaminase [Chloracidobacterium sp.]|uniref:Acetylornithine/succinylornithine family transaminase n=1 Tax=Chloracidobacterium validum TaxID=2821543 RepID=A0ABX8B937_9BACT|nr:acetylornithine/succinylornithine family transaminase [Chloracidobacterium validum]QUW03442.1 acetylornithine/succinylornithine family transaminase [Chloracidobacterium validum]
MRDAVLNGTATQVDPGEETFAALESRHGLGLYVPRGITLTRGQGAYVWDADGRRYLDCTAAYGVASLGHCHPAVVAAISHQAATLIACSGSFGNDQRAQLYAELSTVLPAGLTRVFFCNSGAEANEAALKFARLTTGRTGVVAAMRGFHGRTAGALTATWEPKYREPFEPLLPGFNYIPYNDLAALEAAVTDDVGAVILEVIQGEGGVQPGTADFLQRAQRLCSDRGALLIVDEVQSGFGRTGTFFACESVGLQPDILTMAKGIASGFPMGAVALGERVVKLSPGQHGTTFGGAPLACAAARATLRILRAEQLPAQVAARGAWFLEQLRAIPSERIRDVRGRGFMIGVELTEPAAPYIAAAQARGLLVLNAGTQVIRLLPPLILTEADLAFAIGVLTEVLCSPSI